MNKEGDYSFLGRLVLLNWTKKTSWQESFLRKFQEEFQNKFKKNFQKNFQKNRGDLWLQSLAILLIFLFFFQNCAPSKFEPVDVSQAFKSPNAETPALGLTLTTTPTPTPTGKPSSTNPDNGGTGGTGNGTGNGTGTGTGSDTGGEANGGGTDTGGGVEVPKTESKINDTGQTKCDNGREELVDDCSLVTDPDLQKQDGHLGRDDMAKQGKLSKKGVGTAGFDYTKICMDGKEGCTRADTGASPAADAWACTRDNVTGLVWSLETLNQPAQNFVGQSSIPYSRCNLANGWRMPKVFELLGIMTSQRSYDPFNKDYFPGTVSGMYPSGQTGLTGDQLWTVNFQDGTTNPYGAKNEALNLRLVNGPDTSNSSSLIWDKCPYPALGDDCKIGAPRSYTWHDALKAVKEANDDKRLSSSNWRLPNKMELASIWKAERQPNIHFIDPNLYPDSRASFWTSTNVLGHSAWSIDFQNGPIEVKQKSQSLRIRLVRDP